MEIIKSASKLVFLLLALTACLTYAYGIVTGKTQMDTKDFMVLAGMAFGYYFASKGDQNLPMGGK